MSTSAFHGDSENLDQMCEDIEGNQCFVFALTNGTTHQVASDQVDDDRTVVIDVRFAGGCWFSKSHTNGDQLVEYVLLRGEEIVSNQSN